MASTTPVQSADCKYSSALKYKELGNAAFKTKELKRAIGHYHRSLIFLRGIDHHAVDMPKMLSSPLELASRKQRQLELTDQLVENVDRLKVDCYNNLSACLLRSPPPVDTKRVLQYCDAAMELSPSNQKIWFRRGQANYQAGNYERAEADLLKAKSLNSDQEDASIDRLMAQCRLGLRRHYKEQKSVYQDMFKCT